ncbi:hypothetical protein H696_00439 [Fonticula alba]|uniref:Uncharacterized protein n=1 Tax=Fonticula alba TaxID=691883 RepID=A0A058ZFY6_FONAL|nr:hypothetical protein H696_00439 [Fonticula alba]KCV72866.1 hypothetical protein H696_00439 [Fonticula alba]|eukprot:XP_009492567.1 hypothetical protein H696_00439 [Fonticula alba]
MMLARSASRMLVVGPARSAPVRGLASVATAATNTDASAPKATPEISPEVVAETVPDAAADPAVLQKRSLEVYRKVQRLARECSVEHNREGRNLRDYLIDEIPVLARDAAAAVRAPPSANPPTAEHVLSSAEREAAALERLVSNHYQQMFTRDPMCEVYNLRSSTRSFLLNNDFIKEFDESPPGFIDRTLGHYRTKRKFEQLRALRARNIEILRKAEADGEDTIAVATRLLQEARMTDK